MEENKVTEPENGEQKEELVTPEENTEETEGTAGEKQPSGKAPREISMKTLVMLLAAAGVVVVMLISNITGKDGTEACEIVPQAAWGQQEQQIWIDLNSDLEAQGIAGYGLTYPEGPEGYENKVYRVYTKQINSVYYVDEDGHQGMMIVKAKFCGQDVFEAGYYTDKTEYTFTQIVEEDGKKISMKGNSEGVQVATWTEGEFSYAIGVWSNPVSQEEMLEYISVTE